MIRKLVIAGMPGSGKSTYIAALRHLLVTHEVPTKLTATRLSDAEKHLNKLEEDWIACKKVERTKQAVEEWVSLFVKREADSAEAEIVVPDFSGEAFRRPAATGNCSAAIANMLSEIDGLLLFTNADRGADDVRLESLEGILVDDSPAPDDSAESNDKAAAGEAGTSDKTAASRAAPDGSVPFDPLNMPEEPLLVELLQILNRSPRVPTERMIAVIVSAWDAVEDPELSPEQWLNQHRPMLWQYLHGNRDLWSVRVYGVSAQGGRLPEEKVALQGKIPGQRVQVVGHEAQPHDLTAPIDWLMTSAVGAHDQA